MTAQRFRRELKELHYGQERLNKLVPSLGLEQADDRAAPQTGGWSKAIADALRIPGASGICYQLMLVLDLLEIETDFAQL